MDAQLQNVLIEPTPNPNALKFVVDSPVKTEGKATFRSVKDCNGVPLAQALFDLRAVDQIHFFSNVVTVTKFSFEPWSSLEDKVIGLITELLPEHNPDFEDNDPEAQRRKSLSPELQRIEEILDKRIRPSLQGDGGDLQCITFDDNVLIIKYEGACGTCPSSTTGTLEAIRGILAEEYHPDIEVYTAPPEVYSE